MGDIAMDTLNKDEAAKVEPKMRSRILRYDRVYDTNNSQFRDLKTMKSGTKKQRGRNPLLLVRRLIDSKGFHTGTEVDITSSRVAKVMQEINSNVEDISLRSNPPNVPLKIFYHSRTALQEKLNKAREADPPDDELLADLTETVKFIEEEYAATMAHLASLLSAGEITWELIWAIFPPNALVYRYNQLIEEDQVLKLCSIEEIEPLNKSKYWRVNCRIVVDDGVKFGLAYEPFLMTIDEFAGARKITDLCIFPLEYHNKAAEVRTNALRRGHRFTELRKPRVMETSGPAMFEKRDDNWRPHAFKFTSYGRAMIDPAGFRSFNPNIGFMPEVHKGISRDDLGEEELIICTPIAFGFCLGNKKWGGFAMSRLLDVEWNRQAFQNLVMKESAKTLVHSLVKEHSSQDDAFDDIISGKGKGIICLFSGSPGSGKTLTAEAVAEITNRPLYSVSAGDLGIKPMVVDEKLSETLELSQKWHAVLLLDEADVFLQQRHPQDVTRNALVSIFLRQVEYYQGILILTTNRIEQCDTAFESRIHITIEYPDLDESARRQLWSMFLRTLKERQPTTAIDIAGEEISRLAKIEMNGRQIKNMFNSARIMAKGKGETLSISHIDLVLSSTQKNKGRMAGD